MLMRIALWGPLVIAALLAAGYVYVHQPFKRDGTELLQVPLSEADAALDQVGQLRYLGGLDIPRMDQNIGGLSGLVWEGEAERLTAITDDGRWVWLSLEEEDDRLVSLDGALAFEMLGLDGKPLTGKEQGDSESLTRDPDGGWIVGFERDHRALSYEGALGPAGETYIDPVKFFGALDDNAGLETLAVNDQVLFACVEREATPTLTNCLWQPSGGAPEHFGLAAPEEMVELGAVPTGADTASDGSVFVLFRSYSPADGNSAGIVRVRGVDDVEEIAVLRHPFNEVDNFEGIAVREKPQEDGTIRTFLYIVSDDNFSASQRTLLMKFELME